MQLNFVIAFPKHIRRLQKNAGTICVILLLISPCINAQDSDNSADPFLQLVSHADLTYTQPVKRSEEGMPVGNGTMGSLVWTTPSALHFQINRVDVFANNASSNNFFERHTDYCGGLGFVDVDFSGGDDVFTSPSFRQQLSCYNGQASVAGSQVSAKIIAWMDDDVMAVEITDQRAIPTPINIRLRMLRPPLARRGNHLSLSKVSLQNNHIVLEQKFTEDDYFCGSYLGINVQGRTGNFSTSNDSEVNIVLPPAKGTFTVFISTAATFKRDEDLKDIALKRLERAGELGFEKIFQLNQQWWTSFWKKSYIHLHSKDSVADEIEKHYSYYLYVMASSSRGKYPTKFNGMLWSTGGDTRKWGSLYWGANQSCLYNALFVANHIELLDPVFNMYSSMYGSCADAAVRQWGSKGIFIPETVAFDGLGALPDDVGKEMQTLYLMKKPWGERSPILSDYASTKLPFLSRWNWKKDIGWKNGKWEFTDKGGGPFGHVTHIFSRGAKIAYQYWLKYEYTMDEAWLRNNGYPVIKGVAEFYRNFPNLRKDADGKYHIYHVNDNESIWDGHNTIEEISSMKAIFPIAIRAAEILQVDPDLRSAWKELSENLSSLPLGENEGRSIWKRSLPPFAHGDGNNLPDPNTLPVWFFDLCNLESSDETRRIGNATYDAYFPDGISAQQHVNVLSRLPVAGSLLGREESTRFLIPNQIKTSEIDVMSNRMDLREGEQTTSIQRLGRAAEALHFALCQSVPSSPGMSPMIRLFPAWPKEWDAQFSLLCRGGFRVSSRMLSGKIIFVKIISEQGKECQLRNPWPGKKVTVLRNGKRWKTVSQDKIVMTTKSGDEIVLIPDGIDLNTVITEFIVD